MAIYNLTNATNSLNIGGMITNINQQADLMPMTLLLITSYVITLVTMKNWETRTAFASASMGYSILSLLFFMGGYISEEIMFAFMVLATVGGVILLKN